MEYDLNIQSLNKQEIESLYQEFSQNYGQDPRKMSMHGLLKNILRGRVDFEVYVDRWPTFGSILVKPSRQQISGYYTVGIYSTDVIRIQQMMLELLPLNKSIWISGLAMDLVPTVEQVCSQLKLSATFLSKQDPRKIVLAPPTFHLRKEKIENMKKIMRNLANTLPDEFYFADLDPERDVDSIVDSWRQFNFSDFFQNIEEGKDAIKFYITFGGISLGIFRKSNRKLLAWVLRDIDTSSRMGSILPEYRKTNFSTFYYGELWTRLFADEDVYWGYVAVSNKQSKKALNKVGSYFYEEHDFVYCVLRPRDKAKL